MLARLKQSLPSELPREAIAVMVGGALGASIRWAATEVAGGSVGVLAANLVGALVLGAVLGRREHATDTTGAGIRSDLILRLAIGAGLCGGLTTFSSLAVEVMSRVDAGQPASGAGYLTLTLVTGLAAVAVGHRLGRGRLVRRR